MDVQTLERTFIDKVFAVCDYRLQNMWDRDSRHLYDIAKIISYVNFNEKIKELINKVRVDRMKSKNNPSAHPQYIINEILSDIIYNRFFEHDYNSLTTKLLYEEFSYDKAISDGIQKVLNMKLF